MLEFLADENFNNQIVRGVLRRNPDAIALLIGRLVYFLTAAK